MSNAERVMVWVDGWQTACCGTPFSIGDSIDWTVSSAVDRSFLARVTSPETAETIDYSEEHHDSDEALLGPSGVVRSIRLASCRYRLDEGGGSSPTDGWRRLLDVASTSERPASDGDEDRPGWVVEVEPFRVGWPPVVLERARVLVAEAGSG